MTFDVARLTSRGIGRRGVLQRLSRTGLLVATGIPVHAAAGKQYAAASGGGTGLTHWRPTTPPQLRATELASDATRTLADFAGRTLLINFWATWCAPCLLEMPSLNALARQLSADKLHFVAVNHGEMPERVTRFITQTPIAGTVLLDRQQAMLNAWGAPALPATFIFDARGKPQLWAQGEREWTAPRIVSAIAALP